MDSEVRDSAFKYKHLLAFLFFAVLSILAIGANPLDKETTGPFDLLVSYPGYSSVAPSHLDVRCHKRSDILDARFPGLRKHKKDFYHYLKNFKKRPLDLIEKAYVMVWKPSIFVYMCIPHEPTAYYFSQLIKLIIAGFGTYLFLKLFLSFPASLFGGMVYMLCGFNAAWFYWLQVETSMWIPWLLWAVGLYLIHNKARYLFLITLTSVFLINAGFPAVAAYGFYAAALLIFLYNIFTRKNLRSFLIKSILPLLFIGLGFMISSHYLFNLVHNIQSADLFHRGGAGTKLEIQNINHFFTYNPDTPIGLSVEKSVYIGFLAFAFCLLSFLYLWAKEKAENWKSWYLFSLLLLVLSIVIGYGLIDHHIIRKIPVFSFNPWQRLSVIMNLSIAFLSSFFIEFIFQSRNRRPRILKSVVPVLLVMMFVVQFADQKRYFNQFNGSTPSRYFFPMTPSIEFVKKNIKDYQSIIADYSFNISGTLSYYGFFEWFRHSFRRREERELLLSLAPHSDASPTSFALSARNIDFSSPLMNLFAVKYVFVHERNINFIKAPYFFKQPFTDQTPSPPLPFNRLSQHFTVKKSRDLKAVNLFLGNYKNKSFDSDVLLKLKDSWTQEVMAVTEKNKRTIKDNTWVYFEFEDPVRLKKGEYQFSIELENKKSSAMLSGWSTQRTEGINSYLTVNGEETDLSFIYFLHEANKIYTKNYKIHRLEPTVAVAENLECPEGPYLISDLNEYPPVIKNKSLEYESSAGEIKIHVPQGGSGYVVIPRPYRKEMKAFVDGEKKPLQTYLDVMPAVRVHNHSWVYVKEKTFFPLKGFVLSFVSWLFFIILLFFWGKKKNF